MEGKIIALGESKIEDFIADFLDEAILGSGPVNGKGSGLMEY